ncbi:MULTISPECIES: type II toxin-antitoxin system ParD family antitoxin [unclassified Methylobacterium]|uniref:type II toxin-antitoxin system ParD family antitoxin n=1 Tax=unclassified Methylobacterium TaxID=2615210 RepID=UPI0011C1F3F6|nr:MULTISPECIES: type II toxin-antitoxin system ParD family antitoxin [unclassified Methylobacterium]QEE39185.1 type II toxin-antitoxin system ParD family antitoxin [Methylobacterium sp. WL1]TXN56025.1 type II toxin-antitoxin system ParD family antitoxin [Methylobacterium sp. WL2]
MSNTPTRCVSLTLELETYLRTQVASGRYASASEVVRSALRLMIEREGTILVPRPRVKGAKAGLTSA